MLNAALKLVPNCFDNRPLHLGDAHAQHHLIAAANGQPVDDGVHLQRLVGVGHEADRDLARGFGVARIAHRSHEHDAIVDVLDLHVRSRDVALDQTLEHAHVALDANLQIEQLLAAAVKKKAFVRPTFMPTT